jgi:hypothetical protein
MGFIEPGVGSEAMIARISALSICAAVLFTSFPVTAQQGRSRSLLVPDPSDLRGPLYHSVFSGLPSALSADDRSYTTLYAESLDLNCFRGNACEAFLRRSLKEKYQDVPIGVVVGIGAATLEPVLHWRSELWPGIPIVFSIFDPGPGIHTEKLNEVFDPFFTTRKQKMGIGLSISRTIVHAHNGRISAENQKEGAAVFGLSLPLA